MDRRPRHYVLAGHNVIACTLEQWSQWFEYYWDKPERFVGRTGDDKIWISTVFLGLDHNFFGVGPPLLFETMVFHNNSGEECIRSATWEEAEKIHKIMCLQFLGRIGLKEVG
jgi:hypothetical protein